jgi:hypothetical protein
MSDLIQALKSNKYPFGLMAEEMQEKAREIGELEFECYENNKDNEWESLARFNEYNFSQELTYRLRPDYVEKPKVVECEVRPNEGNHLWYYTPSGVEFRAGCISRCFHDPDFIGFKAGGYIWGCLYICKTTKCPHMWVLESSLHNYDVVSIEGGHALFKENPK